MSQHLADLRVSQQPRNRPAVEGGGRREAAADRRGAQLLPERLSFETRSRPVVFEKSKIPLGRECAEWSAAAAKPSSSYEQVEGAIAQAHGFLEERHG
jgi:hypothetical protein